MMDDDKTALKEKKTEYYQEKPSQYRTCQLTTQRPYGSLDLEFLKCVCVFFFAMFNGPVINLRKFQSLQLQNIFV